MFGSIPAASVLRPPNVVRSGPSTPADTPRIVWQPTQARLAKMALPAAAGPAGSAGVARCAATHRSNAAGASTTTRMPMLACEAPQNSAHWPQYSPGVSGVSVSRLSRPGTTSRLPPSCGTQKLWITSGPSSVSWTGRPAGRWSSFAVATSSAGYRNSHHHWRPRTSTSSAPAAGAACVRKMTWIVGIAIRSSTSAGAIVQESSSSVWPRVCGGGGAPGLSRKRNSTHASPAKTPDPENTMRWRRTFSFKCSITGDSKNLRLRPVSWQSNKGP